MGSVGEPARRFLNFDTLAMEYCSESDANKFSMDSVNEPVTDPVTDTVTDPVLI